MPTKRTRTPAWSITLDDPGSLRAIVEAVHAVLTKVVFRVVKSKGSHFLKVSGADQTMTCVVNASLKLERPVDFEGEPKDEFTFCVDCKHLLVALQNGVCSSGVVIIEGHDDSATILVRQHRMEQFACEDAIELNTYVDGEEPVKINEIEFDIQGGFDLYKLREFIKKAKSARAELMRVEIYHEAKPSGGQTYIFFSSKNEFSVQQRHKHPTQKMENGTLIATTDTDSLETPEEEAAGSSGEEEDSWAMQNMEKKFDDAFPIDKIDAFIKNIHSGNISHHVCKGMPLMLTHNLCGCTDGSSYIRFLVAPVND